MGKSTKLFMWGNQPFRILMESRARDVLQVIAPTVQPRALLVGVRMPEKTDGDSVCVEPEDENWGSKFFFDCAARAEYIYKTHPDHLLFYGDALSMQNKPENVRKKSVCKAVQEVTSMYDSQRGTVTFCGLPARVEGYHIVPVLQFNEAHLLEYPQLAAPIEFEDRVSPTGLLEATITCLLEEAADALGGREPWRSFRTFREDATAILRDAGSRFCTGITFATSGVMPLGVFDTLNVISSLPYEGAEASGELLFTYEKTEAVDIRIRLNQPVQLHDYKLARKVIEMNGRDLLCVCHGAKGISGLGALRAADADGVFRVTFSGHYKWDLYYKNRLLMKTAYGVPRLPSARLNKNVFGSNVRRIFPDIDGDAEQRLWCIVEAAMSQRHGTIIVVSAAAEEEAKRLNKQSLGIEPIRLTPNLVERLSSIDGAVLINPKGICYAIGVILDGMATDEGDPSRGARYNSAIRYIASSKPHTMCLVVSEDGYVNLLPELQP